MKTGKSNRTNRRELPELLTMFVSNVAEAAIKDGVNLQDNQRYSKIRKIWPIPSIGCVRH